MDVTGLTKAQARRNESQSSAHCFARFHLQACERHQGIGREAEEAIETCDCEAAADFIAHAAEDELAILRGELAAKLEQLAEA